MVSRVYLSTAGYVWYDMLLRYWMLQYGIIPLVGFVMIGIVWFGFGTLWYSMVWFLGGT